MRKLWPLTAALLISLVATSTSAHQTGEIKPVTGFRPIHIPPSELVADHKVLLETPKPKPPIEIPEVSPGAISKPKYPTVLEAKAYAKAMLVARYNGDGLRQYECVYKLWKRESGWRPTAMNKSSGAYGIPQALPGSKMASVAADWRYNPITQVIWGLRYISGRYGTPCKALDHALSVGWY